LLGCLLVLIAATALLLNIPGLFFEPLKLWARIGAPILLAAGFIGALLRNKPLRFIGWAGIACLIVLFLGTLMPGEDYTLGGPNDPPMAAPHLVSGAYVVYRLVGFSALSVALIICFHRLAKT